jgi:hypothetical protein
MMIATSQAVLKTRRFIPITLRILYRTVQYGTSTQGEVEVIVLRNESLWDENANINH